MKTPTPSQVKIKQINAAQERTFWYQGQYAIAHRFGSPQQYQRGRIVLKRAENFYIKPFGKQESIAVHQSKVEFFSEDGKRQLKEEQIKDLLKKGAAL